MEDKKYTIVASTTMGLESIVRDECKDLGFSDVQAFNGKVEFTGTLRDIAVANIHLRCADRVYIKMGEFKAFSFEELFQNVKKINWSEFIEKDGNFIISWVSAVKCKLFSKSDIQSITEKAIVENLRKIYKVDRFSKKGAKFAVKIQGNKDVFSIMIDTSGVGLHKRGYRNLINEAPLKETLAAALVMLTRWKGGERPFIDPMCGTGTLPIEAAMIARNIAPGVNRNFAAEEWKIFPINMWIDVRDEAFSKEDYDKEVRIYGSDIDGEAIKVAIENAEKAGVEDDILFENKNFLELESMADKGCVVSNPPYGERLLDDEKVERLYRLLGDVLMTRFPKWSYYIITSYKDFEKAFDKKSTKNRKLFNGGIECHYYQYYGER